MCGETGTLRSVSWDTAADGGIKERLSGPLTERVEAVVGVGLSVTVFWRKGVAVVFS